MEEINLLNGKYNKYISIKSDPRTILLIGRSQTGKTTLINVLKSLSYIQPIPRLYSKTNMVETHEIGTFKVIDMPGFFDHQPFSQQNMQLTNTDILSNIDQCLNSEKMIHLVGFVFKLSTGINNEDIDTMICVKQNYPELASNLALVITHCEELDEIDRIKLVEDFFQTSRVQKENLKEFFQKGVLFMGCIRYKSFQSNNRDALIDEFQQVLKMRTIFIETCIHCKPLYVNQYSRCHTVKNNGKKEVSLDIVNNGSDDERRSRLQLLQSKSENTHAKSYGGANDSCLSFNEEHVSNCCTMLCLAMLHICTSCCSFICKD